MARRASPGRDSAGALAGRVAAPGPENPPMNITNKRSIAARAIGNILSDMFYARTIISLGILSAVSCASRGVVSTVDGEMQQILVAEQTGRLELLKDAVRSPNANVRARAARAIGRIGNKDGIVILKNLALDTEDPVVTSEALFAWGLLGGEEVGQFANNAVLQWSASESVRATWIESIGRGKAVDKIIKLGGRSSSYGDGTLQPGIHGGNIFNGSELLIKDTSALVRGEAALAIGRLYPKQILQEAVMKEFGSDVTKLVKSLADITIHEKDADARWKETYAMMGIDSPSVHVALLTMVKDNNPLVRLFAVRGLGKRRNDKDNRQWSGFDHVIAETLADPDPRVAAEAALAISSKNATEEMFAALLKLKNRPEYYVRRAMLKAARNFGDRQKVVFKETAGDPSPMVRGERAMLRNLDAADYENLIKSPEPIVREKVADAVAALPPDVAVPFLTILLNDTDYQVAAGAATALGKVKDPRANVLLQKALAHPRGLVRENAASAFEEIATDIARITKEDIRSLVESAATARGDDLAESLSGIIVAIEKCASPRRDAAKDKLKEEQDPAEVELRERTRVMLVDALSNPDITVRTKAELAWKSLFTNTPPPKIMIPEPARPAIPGVDTPPFVRAPKIRIFTNRGSFDAELFHEDAPVHVENMLMLIKQGHYNNTPWHRAELNFVVQGGDHLGDGTGAGAAWGGTLRDEINQKRFVRGTLGMPKSDVNNSGGCQIFITHIPTPHLDGRYTAYGQVTIGLDVVDALEVHDRITRIEILDPGR